MNQFILMHFTLNKNNRFFELSVQPGAPWEDVQAVLDDFKQHMNDLQQEAIKKEQEMQAAPTDATN